MTIKYSSNIYAYFKNQKYIYNKSYNHKSPCIGSSSSSVKQIHVQEIAIALSKVMPWQIFWPKSGFNGILLLLATHFSFVTDKGIK